MSAPAWLAGSFAVLMIVIAVCCAARLAISRLPGRNTELDTDALHVLMGVAMAGMLEPRLTPVPVTAWRAVFAAAAAWFAWQAIPGCCAGQGTLRAPGGPRRRMRRHGLHAAARRLLALGPGPGMAMPGMSQGTTIGNPALTLVLALFMLGYVLWAIDRLAYLSRTPAPATARATTARRPPRPARSCPRHPGRGRSRRYRLSPPCGSPALAPRLAASYKIAMAITMGYMLITML